MAQTINIQRLWDQKYRDESVPFPVDGTVTGQASVFNVMDSLYGARGDGTTNDTAAIQAAINAAGVNGGTVFFPPGSYKITSGLVWADATARIAFQGAGPSGYSSLLGGGVSRILVPVGVTGLTYGPTGTSHYVGAPVIRDLHFQGPGASANSSTVGLAIKNVSGGRVSDSTFSDFYTAGTGVQLLGVPPGEQAYTHFHGCRFIKNFIGADCNVGNVGNGALGSFMSCLFDAENNALPTPVAGSKGLHDPFVVFGCELQSYETLIDLEAVALTGISYVANRHENFLTAVKVHPASTVDYGGQIVGGAMSSAVGGCVGVSLNANTTRLTVDIRSFIAHSDLGSGNTILDPRYGYRFHVPTLNGGAIANTPLEFGVDGTDRFQIFFDRGAAWMAAPPGSLYINLNGGAGTTLYVKESGTGSSGWVAK